MSHQKHTMRIPPKLVYSLVWADECHIYGHCTLLHALHHAKCKIHTWHRAPLKTTYAIYSPFQVNRRHFYNWHQRLTREHTVHYWCLSAHNQVECTIHLFCLLYSPPSAVCDFTGSERLPLQFQQIFQFCRDQSCISLKRIYPLPVITRGISLRLPLHLRDIWSLAIFAPLQPHKDKDTQTRCARESKKTLNISKGFFS